jgi:hypothetical protein
LTVRSWRSFPRRQKRLNFVRAIMRRGDDAAES